MGRAVAAFIAVYWGARVVIQFAYYDTSNSPSSASVKVGTLIMELAFVCLTAVYMALALGMR